MLHSSGKENKLFMILDFLHKKNFDAVVEKRAFSTANHNTVSLY